MHEELVEQGIVINSQSGLVEVELLESDNCEECSAKLFCNPKKDSKKTLTIKNPSHYELGEKVNISILGKSLFQASVNLYLYPLLILVGSIYVSMEFFSESKYSEVYSFLIAIVLVTIYYLGFFQISKKFNQLEPNILISKSE